MSVFYVSNKSLNPVRRKMDIKSDQVEHRLPRFSNKWFGWSQDLKKNQKAAMKEIL